MDTDKNETETSYQVTLVEHSSSSYSPRTYDNAHLSDLTIAFALDFSTAGERCTLKAAGNKYVAVPLTWNAERSAQHIGKHIFESGAKRLNIAGNGIYTLGHYGYTQQVTNQKVYDVLKLVLKSHEILEIRSGGQTGVDLSALVAGMALKVKSIGLFPKGFRQRLDDGVDYSRDPDAIYNELVSFIYELTREGDNLEHNTG